MSSLPLDHEFLKEKDSMYFLFFPVEHRIIGNILIGWVNEME